MACLCILLFSLNISHVYAQSEASEQPRAEDPLDAFERALTQEGGTNSGQSAANPPSSIWVIFRTLLVLILAAAAIYGVVFLIKKASRRTEAQDPFLKVLASAPLGSGRYAHVVGLGSKAWLIGAAENGVNLISEIDEKEILDALFLDDSKRSAGGRVIDFKTVLSRFGMQVKSGLPGTENISKRRDRLKGL